MHHTYHVYIMASASRVLYIGVTGHLLRRVRDHKEKRIPGFTARYRVTELVYFEAFGDIRMAIVREKQLKGWLREKKIALIESFNPHWRDLAPALQSPMPNTKPREILRSAQNDNSPGW
jgi:putative endonuclease